MIRKAFIAFSVLYSLMISATFSCVACQDSEPDDPCAGLRVCPDDVYTTCEDFSGDGGSPVLLAPCCFAGEPLMVCAIDGQGFLSHVCPGCPESSGVCAVDPSGPVTCCAFGGCD